MFGVSYDTFTNTYCYAPLKKQKIHSNHNKFMTKKVSKEVIARTRLRNKYSKNRTYENKSSFQKQPNNCTYILKKTKTNFFNNIDIKKFTDNKRFLTAVKPFFTDIC